MIFCFRQSGGKQYSLTGSDPLFDLVPTVDRGKETPTVCYIMFKFFVEWIGKCVIQEMFVKQINMYVAPVEHGVREQQKEMSGGISGKGDSAQPRRTCCTIL